MRPTEAKPFQLRMDLRHRVARGMKIPAERIRTMESALTDGRRVRAVSTTPYIRRLDCARSIERFRACAGAAELSEVIVPERTGYGSARGSARQSSG